MCEFQGDAQSLLSEDEPLNKEIKYESMIRKKYFIAIEREKKPTPAKNVEILDFLLGDSSKYFNQ